MIRLAGLALLLASGTAATQPLPPPDRGGVPENKIYDYGMMGPPATSAVVKAAVAAVRLPEAKGPFRPTWPSIEANYRTPDWYADVKFGIFLHWGVYSVPAHNNEWYEKHMYESDRDWHAANFGPQERFGYRDFIPRFTASRWNPDAWATLFRMTGARFVMPTAQHHDNFALWNSGVTRFNSVAMGPKRDLVGDLATAVRKQGMRFGVSNHGMENFTFVNPVPALDTRLRAAKADLYDPRWAAFYNVADRSPAAMTRFLTDWVDRNVELIDKYHPDILWFDNGVNLRVLDPLKLQVAAYYYNRAREWGKQVSISTKFVAYAPSNDDRHQIGSILDFEQIGPRSPTGLRPGPWLVDDTIGSTWGYTRGMTVEGPDGIVARLVDTVAKGGTYLLNISPMADGTIPQDQRATLLGVGKWMQVNGEAIYATRSWTCFGEGDTQGVRFTTKGDRLYAIALGKPGAVRIVSLGLAAGKVTQVTLLGSTGKVRFRQDSSGLSITPPSALPDAAPYGLSYRITFATRLSPTISMCMSPHPD